MLKFLKLLVFTSLYLMVSYGAFSQISEVSKKQVPMKKNWYPEFSTTTADLSIFATYGYQSYNRYDQNWMVGIAAEMGFAEQWSANYRIQGGPDYFHFPVALPFAAVCLVFTQPVGGYYWNIDWVKYLFLIPEGVSYSFDPIPGLTVKPYLNPLGVTVLRETDAQNISYWEAYMMLSAGGSVQLTAIRTWGISAYGEYRYSWNGQRNGVQTGIRVSHNFDLANRWPFLN